MVSVVIDLIALRFPSLCACARSTIELTPMIHDGKPVVEFKHTGFVSYMGLNGTTTNGTLMVQIRDVDSYEARLRAEGWR